MAKMAEFRNFEELSAYMNQLSEETYSIFTISDCRTIESANKRVAPGQKKFDAKFKYSFIKFGCKHFGSRRSSSSGLRPNQRTFKIGCPCFVYVSADRSKDRLVITRSELNHNHDTSKELFTRYPEKRRVDEREKRLIEGLQQMNVPSNTICQHLRDIHGKHLNVKDIQNIHQKGKSAKDEDSEILQVLEDFCRENEDNTALIEVDHDSNTIGGIFLQTKQQRDTLQQFPEVIHLDVTYRVNKAGMSLYVALVEDGNLKGCSVAYALLSNDHKESIHFFLNSVKILAPVMETNTTCFIVDKDFSQMSVIQALFPNAKILLCHFHILKTFKQEVKRLKLDDKKKSDLKQSLQSLVYASTEEIFNKHLHNIRQIAPDDFLKYFTDNWDNCKPLWAPFITNSYRHFNIKTNNRLERDNQELKKKLNSHITVAECMRRILKCSKESMMRKDRQLFSSSVCKSYNVFDEDEIAKKIRTTATPYAARITIQQYSKSKELGAVSVQQLAERIFSVGDHEIDMSNNEPRCNCDFFTSMSLPCKHIFLVMCKENFEFHSEFLAPRWRKEYQHQTAKVVVQPAAPDTLTTTAMPLSRKEKFTKLKMILLEIADTCSEVSNGEFEMRYYQVSKLKDIWTAGLVANITAVDIPSKDCNAPSKDLNTQGGRGNHEGDVQSTMVTEGNTSQETSMEDINKSLEKDLCSTSIQDEDVHVIVEPVDDESSLEDIQPSATSYRLTSKKRKRGSSKDGMSVDNLLLTKIQKVRGRPKRHSTSIVTCQKELSPNQNKSS